MGDAQVPESPISRVGVVHLGGFSGTTPSIIGALRACDVEVEPFDVAKSVHSIRSLPDRARAIRQARGEAFPWTRTLAWSDAIGRHVEALPDLPLIFLQTVLACEVAPERRYVVLTDRVAAETTADPSPWASVSAPAWLAREAQFLERANRVFVMGPTTADTLRRTGVESVSVVGSGTNCAVPPLRDRRSEQPQRLLFLSKDWERNGGPGLVETIDLLHATTRHQVSLDVVGCRPLISRPWLTYHGEIDPQRLAPIIEQAHVLALPTLHEAFGVAYVEAISAGVPVFGASTGNVPWIVGGAGVTPDPRDTGAMVTALDELLTRYSSFASAAFERGGDFRRGWTWQRIASQLLDGVGVRPPVPPIVAPDEAERPIVHAVVVTHNRSALLRQTLDSVSNQQRVPDRVTVVDNASVDDTKAVLESEFPDVEILRMTENLGPAGGITVGMRQALRRGADVIWLVEDDTTYDATYVLRGLERLTGDPAIALVGSSGWDFNGYIWRSCPEPLAEPRFGALPMLDGLMLRRDEVLQIGFPRSDFFIMIQDVEYPLRFVEAGFMTVVDPELRSLRLGAGAARPELRPTRSYYQTRNHLRLALDRSSPRLLAGFARRTAGLVVSDLRTDDPMSNLVMRWRGMADGARGRLGRTVELDQRSLTRRRRTV